MKIIIDTHVKMRWNNFSRKHYESLGYLFTKGGDWFDVRVQDLTKNSHTKVKVQCDFCGDVKERTYQHHNAHVADDGKYCCRTCANKIKIPKIIFDKYGVHSPLLIKGVREKGRQKMIEKYGVPYPTQNEEFKKKYLYGEKNHKWKDGRHQDLPDRKKDPRIIVWRKAIFKKYNYKCLVCKSNKNLNAHHFDSYDENIELRYDLDNGVALCEICHIEFHRKNGYGQNTFEQFMHWLEGKVNRLWVNPSTAEDELPLEVRDISIS